jgi:1-phosphofructokinase family hexose kinase
VSSPSSSGELLFLSLSTADQTIWLLPRYRHGEVNRTKDVRRCVGGKAVNAARTAHILGGRCVVVGFFSADLVTLLGKEGIEVEPVEPAKPVRRATSVVDLEGGQVSELVEEAHPPRRSELERVVDRFTARAGDAAVVCLCGSVPEGMPPTFYATLLSQLPGHRVIVDTQGEALRAALGHGPYLVKPNRRELEGVLGQTAPSLADVAKLGEELRARGAKNVAVSCGTDGLLLIGEGPPTFYVPPSVTSVNTTGCGDAVTGAVAYGLGCGMTLAESAKLSVAVAAATARHPVPGGLDPGSERHLAARVVERSP